MPTSLPATIGRAIALYFVMLVMIRILGKRSIGNFTAFDLLVALMVSDMVGDVVFGDVSFTQGLAGILTIAALEYASSWLSYSRPRLESLLEGDPTVVVSEGNLVRAGMRRERMSEAEVEAALRQEGVDSIQNVRLAIVESDGHVSVLTYSPR